MYPYIHAHIPTGREAGRAAKARKLAQRPQRPQRPGRNAVACIGGAVQGGKGSARAGGALGLRGGLVPVPFESAGVVDALGGGGKDARGAAGTEAAGAGGAGAGGRAPRAAIALDTSVTEVDETLRLRQGSPRAAIALDTSVTEVDETPRLRQGSPRAATGAACGSEGGADPQADAPRSACSRKRGGGTGGGAGACLSTYSSTSRARLDEETRAKKRGASAREAGGQEPVGVDKMKYGSVANRYQCVP